MRGIDLIAFSVAKLKGNSTPFEILLQTHNLARIKTKASNIKSLLIQQPHCHFLVKNVRGMQTIAKMRLRAEDYVRTNSDLERC